MARIQDISGREDTRRKIQFGGLVIKAGLENETPAVLLGVLVEAARAIEGGGGDGARERFRQIGNQAFAEGLSGGEKQ